MKQLIDQIWNMPTEEFQSFVITVCTVSLATMIFLYVTMEYIAKKIKGE